MSLAAAPILNGAERKHTRLSNPTDRPRLRKLLSVWIESRNALNGAVSREERVSCVGESNETTQDCK